MKIGPKNPQPEDQFANLVSRMLELPLAHRVLSLRARGRAVQVVRGSGGPLGLRLDGSWTAGEKERARALMRAAADRRPELVRLLDPEDPGRGVEFPSENQYSASDLVYRLVTGALGVDPAELAVERDYEDHDARPAIAAVLKEHGAAEILHPESGVRVRVKLYSSGYSLRVPTASLDPRRGQRHRAREAISDAGWRLNDGDLGSEPDVAGPADDPGNTWGYSADSGGASEAADRALRLLCAIAEAPIDVRVSIA